MKVDLQIQVRDGMIVVDSRYKDHHRELKNIQGLIPNGTVVAIGQNLADLIRENPQNADKFREEVKFEPLYTSSARGLDNLFFFIELQILQLRRGKGVFSRLVNPESISCSLDLPDYESIDEDVRKPFEFSLTKFVVRELKINGKVKGWERWHRQVLEISRPIFLMVWPVLWYLSVLLIYPILSGLGLAIWIFYIAVFFALYYFVILLRVLILKNFLPHDLLRSEMLSPRIGLGKFGQFMVEKFFNTK
jgi:hypothetical protein